MTRLFFLLLLASSYGFIESYDELIDGEQIDRARHVEIYMTAEEDEDLEERYRRVCDNDNPTIEDDITGLFDFLNIRYDPPDPFEFYKIEDKKLKERCRRVRDNDNPTIEDKLNLHCTDDCNFCYHTFIGYIERCYANPLVGELIAWDMI